MIEENEGASKSGLGVKPLIVVAIVIIAAVGGIFAYNEFLKPEPALVTATVTIDFGNGTVLTEEVGSDNNTALGVLKAYVGPENIVAEAGFVSSINGIETVDDVPELEGTEARYWMFYVNGTMPMESAATLEVFDGDLVEFKFEVSPW
ncbi:MAG: DUF4430 domain-containing protein [Thermoplasmata archaeon]|nr:DUF4430 domain-containing protein [Thermoplasmata archaeon]